MEELKESRYICVDYDEWLVEMYKKLGIEFRVVKVIELDKLVN